MRKNKLRSHSGRICVVPEAGRGGNTNRAGKRMWRMEIGSGSGFRTIVSAPVPVPFLRTLDFGPGFGTWIWDWTWDLGPGFGTWIWDWT